MTTPIGIHDRFYEVPAPLSAEERLREAEGWAVVMDRATGKALVICGNDRAGALWIIRALNHYDRTSEHLPGEHAA